MQKRPIKGNFKDRVHLTLVVAERGRLVAINVVHKDDMTRILGGNPCLGRGRRNEPSKVFAQFIDRHV